MAIDIIHETGGRVADVVLQRWAESSAMEPLPQDANETRRVAAMALDILRVARNDEIWRVHYRVAEEELGIPTPKDRSEKLSPLYRQRTPNIYPALIASHIAKNNATPTVIGSVAAAYVLEHGIRRTIITRAAPFDAQGDAYHSEAIARWARGRVKDKGGHRGRTAVGIWGQAMRIATIESRKDSLRIPQTAVGLVGGFSGAWERHQIAGYDETLGVIDELETLVAAAVAKKMREWGEPTSDEEIAEAHHHVARLSLDALGVAAATRLHRLGFKRI